MSRLLLVRHSQASFFADDYDQLSPLGERQARALGEHWVKLGIGFDEIVVGPRNRQIGTETIVRSVYEANGKEWPKADVRREFDEHCAAELMTASLTDMLRHHPQLQPAATAYRDASTPEQVQRSFQRLFEATCHLWCAAAPGTDSIETWTSFHARVESGLRRILSSGGSSRAIAVFTSVGNITVALGLALGCSPTHALELGWRLRNCSVTELVFSGERVTLDYFNSVAHLNDPTTWTFR
jgi:broad specificity phosphatase PhoE